MMTLVTLVVLRMKLSIIREPRSFLVEESVYLQKVLLPLDTGRNLNVHKTFRRHPGRLLNILFTFKLRLVSGGLYLC